MGATKDFLGRGWRFPPMLDPVAGRIALSSQRAKVEESMRIVLATAPRERVMRPEFGCGVHELVFGSPDSTTIGRVETLVTDALRRWEPRIDLVGVHATFTDELAGKLVVKIDYVLRSVDRRDNLVYPYSHAFELKEST